MENFFENISNINDESYFLLGAIVIVGFLIVILVIIVSAIRVKFFKDKYFNLKFDNKKQQEKIDALNKENNSLKKQREKDIKELEIFAKTKEILKETQDELQELKEEHQELLNKYEELTNSFNQKEIDFNQLVENYNEIKHQKDSLSAENTKFRATTNRLLHKVEQYEQDDSSNSDVQDNQAMINNLLEYYQRLGNNIEKDISNPLKEIINSFNIFHNEEALKQLPPQEIIKRSIHIYNTSIALNEELTPLIENIKDPQVDSQTRKDIMKEVEKKMENK